MASGFSFLRKFGKTKIGYIMEIDAIAVYTLIAVYCNVTKIEKY